MWHRRLCEAAFLLSLVVVALAAWPLVIQEPVLGHAQVPLLAGGVGLATMLVSAIFFFVRPQKDSFWPGFLIFLLFSTTIGTLVATTGGLFSPYAASFLLVTFFAGTFGFYGVIPVLVAVAFYTAATYLGGHLDTPSLVLLVANGLFPLIVGFILWDNREDTANSSGAKQMNKIANQLTEVASRSEVVINAIGDGVVAIDAQGTIQLINPAAQALLGWSKQDAMTLNYKSVLHLTDAINKDVTPEMDPVQQALNTNQEVRDSNLAIVTKSTKKIFAAMVVSPIGEAGSGVIVVFRDVTKEKQEEREQAEFISTASHEMRTPVASIEGYLGLALNPQTSQIDEKARSFIMKAHESAQHLGRLFQDLLDVSKAEDGRLSNNPKVVNIVPFVQDLVVGLTPKAQEKGLQIIYKPTDQSSGQRQIAPIYYVNLDNDHIREVTNNLIENAIKYTPQGSVVVDVTSSDDNSKVIVSIKDSGIGIPAEDIPHLFQKFYRVDNEDTRQIGGTGLGLYLCRRLAEAMEGRIWLESEYKKGSTFYLELPRLDNSQAEVLAQQQAQQAATQPMVQPVAPAPVAQVIAPTPTAPPAGVIQDVVKPATTVPRGEALTREQIAAHVARLEALAKNQQAAAAVRPPGTPQT
jgi:PAS domain S-box-containing protein